MSEREWPKDNARAWLLRVAANFIEDGALESEAQELIWHASTRSDGWETETGFRRLIESQLCWDSESIDHAVADVRAAAEQAS